MSDDPHACGWDRIPQIGDLEMHKNPLNMLLNGPTGTRAASSSRVRGVGATAPTNITLERNVDPIEKNGFSIIDVTPEKITASLFSWREPDPVESINTLEPFDVVEIQRNA